MSGEVRYPSAGQVDRLYGRVMDETGGEYGYLSRSNLEYLLGTVKDVGERLPRKEAIVKKAAFLLYNVVVLHPFLNGNKRTAYELVKLFLESNGFKIGAKTNDVYKFLLRVASIKASESEVEDWIATHLADSTEQ